MKKHIVSFALLSVFITAFSCDKSNKTDEVVETFSTGEATFFVEESIVPIFDAINEVFMFSNEKAKITIESKTENEIVSLLLKDSVKIAILPRKLNENELKYFEGRKEVNMTPFAKDAIIFITSKNNNDSLIDLKTIYNLIQNPDLESDNVIVFDNINSSLSQYFKNKVGVSEFGKNVYFAKDTKEVIDYTSKNSKAIGIVGINWLLQPNEDIKEIKKTIKSLKVLSDDNNYYLPTQSNIANNSYPLIRELYIIDVQGKNGLGKGLSSFASSEKGQRIVLKSGLFPFKQPTREIILNKN